MNPNLWTPEDAQQLRGLRSSSNIDLSQLARTFALSEAQILELEGQGDGHFYNAGIKYRTGKRLLGRFGILTVAERQQMPDLTETPVRSTTDENFSISDADREALGWVQTAASQPKTLPVHWPRVGALAAVLLVVVGGLWWWLHDPSPPVPVVSVLSESASSPAASVLVADQPVPSSPLPTESTPSSDMVVQVGRSELVQAPNEKVEVVEDVPSKVRVAALEVACRDQMPEGDVQRFVPAAPLKGDHYVFLTARSTARVCVRDASGRLVDVRLSKGGQRSVLGRAPFTVYGSGLSQVRVFFRGRPVPLEASTQQLVLGK